MRDGKHIILCIDDDDDILESLELILESSGYIFLRAPTAEEGLQLYQEESPDLVIVDLMMEEVDSGLNFARELLLLGNDKPVYLLSSVGDSLNYTTDHARLGLTGVLQKPIEPRNLLGLLRIRLR